MSIDSDPFAHQMPFTTRRICVFHPCGLRLETTGTTGKNNERAPKECCFKQLFPIIKKPDGELRRCALYDIDSCGNMV